MKLQLAFYAFHLLVPIAGISLNIYVLWRLLRVARKNFIRFETSSGLPLAAMSVSDSITLAAMLLAVIFHSIAAPGASSAVLNGICKFDLYLMHTTSAFSVWCWLALSILRYTAVFHPLKYRTIWRQPRNALTLLVVSCCILEGWILVFVVYGEEGCADDSSIPLSHIKMAHLMDISMFFAIPYILRIFFDGVVLFHCYNPITLVETPSLDRRCAISVPVQNRRCSSSDCENSDIQSRMALVMSISANTSEQHVTKRRQMALKKKTEMVMRSIIISVLNLALNLPSHIIRAWSALEESTAIDTNQNSSTTAENLPSGHDSMAIFQQVSQILYFSQFACNAFYLSTSIYESTSYPRNTVILNNGRQISRNVSRDDDS